MSFDKYVKEVSAIVSKAGNTVPAQRSAFKKGFSFSKLPFDEQLPIWNYIWKNGNSFWVRTYAFFFLEKYVTKKELHEAMWQLSVKWQEEVNDWPLCDSLSKVYTKILETQPDKVYPQLVKWNKSKDLWKRRQSVVSLLYYTRTKKVVLAYEQIESLVTPLLNDDEYYVQKGVGWALRELYNAYPRQTHAYFKKHIKDISAIAFTAAMEKMPSKEKEALKAIRKENRITPPKS